MSKTIFSVFFICSIGIYCVKALSALEDLKQTYTKMLKDCVDEYPLSSEDSETLKKKQIPDKEQVKCLFACAFKKTGMMNDKGELSAEGIQEIIKKYFADNVEEIKKNQKFTEACLSVNSEPVSDGTKGCERAALIFKCAIAKIPEFSFGF